MKRVLFVDDEPNVLQGLRRMLRSHRHVWHMEFLSSPDEALQAIENEPFDVVVSDMRMPGMDGSTLLKRVREISPRTVRIILSGYGDLDAAMRSVCVSHQFLSKPCDPDQLQEIVDRACHLENLLQDDEMRGTVGDIAGLPVLSDAYEALVGVLERPEVDLRDVAAVVARDQAITAKVLQLVNSSFFGVRRRITSVRQATSYLGLKTIRDLVVTTEIFRQFEGTSVDGFSLERVQAHALANARLASRMFEDRGEAEQAFLAGMLHDVGKLVMAVHMPDRLTSALRGGAGLTVPSYECEQALAGASHAEIGAYLLGLWGMPYPIVEAVAHHHAPSRAAVVDGLGPLIAVHVADVLLHEIDATPLGARPELDLELLERLGLSGRLPEWRELAEREVLGSEAAA